MVKTQNVVFNIFFVFCRQTPDAQATIKLMADCLSGIIGKVSTVVNSVSPEGHLPMDFSQGNKVYKRLQQRCIWGHLGGTCPPP